MQKGVMDDARFIRAEICIVGLGASALLRPLSLIAKDFQDSLNISLLSQYDIFSLMWYTIFLIRSMKLLRS